MDQLAPNWSLEQVIGKSFTLAAMLVERALEKRGLSLCISTGSRAASEIVRKSVMFAEAVKKLSHGRLTYTSGFDHVTFSNGARVMSLPSSTDGANLRGWTASCVCIDEAAWIPHLEKVLQAISPTLSRDPSAELVLTTTPAGRNGPFYDLWVEARDHPEVWHV